MNFPNVVYQSDGFSIVENDHGWAKLTPVKGAGAAIIPVLGNGDILMVREFRETLKGSQLQWNIPRGATDSNETSEETAARELMEETGMVAGPDRIIRIASICPDNGLLLHSIPLFAALLHGLPVNLKADGKEVIDVRAFSPHDIGMMAINGEMTDAFTLSAITVWNAFCNFHRVTRAGTHNIAISFSVTNQRSVVETINRYAPKLRAAGWHVSSNAMQAAIRATWLPGRRPELESLEEPALGSLSALCRCLPDQ